MPTETEELQTEIIIMQVFQYMLANSVSRRAACEALNLSYGSFNHKLADHPETLKDFLAKQKEVLQLNLSQIMMAQQEILKGLLDDASNTELSMVERMGLYNHFERLQEKFARNLGVETEQEKGAREFLKGAHLKPGIAKVTKTETTELTFDLNDIENPLPTEVIDVIATEHKPPNDFIDAEKE